MASRQFGFLAKKTRHISLQYPRSFGAIWLKYRITQILYGWVPKTTMIDPSLDELLKHIRKRPRAYFGDSPALLYSVSAFIDGYQHSMKPHGICHTKVVSGAPFPTREFTDFLQYKRGFRVGLGWRWADLIAQKYGPNERGMDEFFNLLVQFKWERLMEEHQWPGSTRKAEQN